MSRAQRFSLKPAIAAEQREFFTRDGIRVSYYVDDTQTGCPLLLLHSINAAPSAMEVRPLFDHYRQERAVYAIELPGFGFSQRGNLNYTPALFSAVIAEFVGSVLTQAPDVIALSLSAEFAARARVDYDMTCRSLVLISPTGMGRREPPDPAVGERVVGVLRKPFVGASLWRALTSKPSIRWFLGQAFYGKTPKGMIDYAYETARQPDAQFAPFAFLGMGLFTRNALDLLYARLDVPVLVVYDRDPNIDFEQLPELQRLQPSIQALRIAPSRGLPHWELPEKTFEALGQFWSGLN